jgi:ABC-type antimicrobial peptide transport system permease subunit
MDALDLARLQFATTTSFHFLFVLLTLGLVTLVAVVQTWSALARKPVLERMTRFWGRIYVVNYALGIATGIVMEFQFGLNWSGLSTYAGDVFGAPLAIETLVAFFLIRLVPGDPIETMAGERGIDPERHAKLLKEYGLDQPVFVQYGIYIGRVLHGDLGKSMITQVPVLHEFLALFPATMELAVGEAEGPAVAEREPRE